MKNVKKILLFLLPVLMTVSLLSSCVQKPQGELTFGTTVNEEFVPSGDMDEDTVALAARYEEYRENAALAFKQNQATSEEFFEVESYENGVKVTSYKGSENIVVIPDAIGELPVVALGETSFADSTVRAVFVPDSVALIEKGAFANCTNISTLRLPFVGDGRENTHFGYIFGANSYENHATKVPASLDMVILGGAASEIAENAFAHCKSLSAVVVANELEKIGEFAFYECRDLVYFDMTNSIKEVGDYAFSYCSSLFSCSFSKADRIGFGAFFECNSIRSLTLPFVGESDNENRYLGYIFGAESADYNDEFVPESLYEIELVDCKYIPDRAFASCAYIAKFIICGEVEGIGRRAFYSCRSIIDIELPDTVKTIGDDAFFGCDNLTAVYLGDNVESIGMQAFYGCSALKRISVPKKVTEIMPSTFALCVSLESVELNNVKKIGKDAFWGCTSLKGVDCDGIEVSEGNDGIFLDYENLTE